MPDKRAVLLLCLDLEAGSEELAHKGAMFAERTGMGLHVLYVLPPSSGEGEDAALERLATLADRAFEGKVDAPIEVRRGRVEEIIMDCVREVSVDTVILGHRHKARRERVYVGSTVKTVISLAVAVVPEGFPAVVTITLALGVRAMVRRKALLRRLQAAETLGSATVICSDKTGTLTQNEMTVQRVVVSSGEFDVRGVGYAPEGEFLGDGGRVDCSARPDLLTLLETGIKCNHARIYNDDEGWHKVGELIKWRSWRARRGAAA